MSGTTINENKRTRKLSYITPDGGYGYVVAAALMIFTCVTFVPNTCFGLIYGSYLAQIGDETRSVTTVTSFFNTAFHFSGIFTNLLLQKCSERTVALIGALMIFGANLGTIFVTTVEHLVMTYAVIQGLGIGIFLAAILTVFNLYFDEKKKVVMGVGQSFTVMITIFYPMFVKNLLDAYGFRGTVAILAAISSHVILAAVSLHPVKMHMKKVVMTDMEIEFDLRQEC
ncbi:monocarboxylate transporter 13-like [Agrilus planipennis]|uniref:Monocarboxylate transporter 13-like n=1 Tax=Agrilus planipennis TaxID=224129 RepID=A0A7F5RM36_AGRPL|nr:monocarboxylate transporter 13-like [Agrilus planipennis]